MSFLPCWLRLFLGRSPEPTELARVLDSVGLSDRASHLPKELSGGQMPRVAIGRALIVQPRVITLEDGRVAGLPSLE